jgi:hypothetical protein
MYPWVLRFFSKDKRSPFLEALQPTGSTQTRFGTRLGDSNNKIINFEYYNNVGNSK